MRIALELGFVFLFLSFLIVWHRGPTVFPKRVCCYFNDLMVSCFGPFVAQGFAVAGVICLIVGGIIGLCS